MPSSKKSDWLIILQRKVIGRHTAFQEYSGIFLQQSPQRCFYALKGQKNVSSSIISINQLATSEFLTHPYSCFPAVPPEARYVGTLDTLDQYNNKPFKVFFIRLHLKNNGDVWSCSATATTASRTRRSKRSHKSAYDLVNIKKIISATESESEESERFHFLPTPSLTFRLRSSENQIVGVEKRSGRINQSRCTLNFEQPVMSFWYHLTPCERT